LALTLLVMPLIMGIIMAIIMIIMIMGIMPLIIEVQSVPVLVCMG
jgi:hypothetical protein